MYQMMYIYIYIIKMCLYLLITATKQHKDLEQLLKVILIQQIIFLHRCNPTKQNKTKKPFIFVALLDPLSTVFL